MILLIHLLLHEGFTRSGQQNYWEQISFSMNSKNLKSLAVVEQVRSKLIHYLTTGKMEIRPQRSNVNAMNLLKNKEANINIPYLTEIRVCTESLIVENVSLKICKPIFETLKGLKNKGNDKKNGKEEVFIFVFNYRLRKFGTLLYQHCSVVTA